MKLFRIEGGRQLSGKFSPVGNKNSVLKLIAASILFKGDYKLTNVPAISDVEVMLEIIAAMGGSYDYHKEESMVVINTDNLNTTQIPRELSEKIRASVVFVGPLLARFGEVSSSFPGGDKIGPRELKAHFSGLLQIGYKFSGNEWGEFKLSGDYQGGHIHMYEASVTATENLIMAACLGNGTTVISGAACEPHIQELCAWLNSCGANISGIGSNVLRIGAPNKLDSDLLSAEKPKYHKIWTDYIDVATGITAAIVTGGDLEITDVRSQDLATIDFFLRQLGVNFSYKDNNIFVPAEQELVVSDPVWARSKGIYSQPWYGFPSDLMSITIVLAMFVRGSTLFFEKLYPNRMEFSVAFNSAGGNIIVCDPHRIVVNGPVELRGFKYNAPDLRAGMAYLLASLAAKGDSEILGVEHIYRGYPNIVERFKTLGASIEEFER